MIFNDHGNTFFLDKVPTLAVGVAETYRPVDEGWGPRSIPDFEGAQDFSWHLVDTMVESHFDPLVCMELDVDHGMQVPMELFFGRPTAWPAKVVPILVNTIQYPIPTPQRMWELGRVLRRAIETWETDETVAVLGTGGLSHQLQGRRAGFLNPEADRAWIAEIGPEPGRYRDMTREDFVETFGSEGAELIMWLVMRGAMDDVVRTVHSHYHSPASMTGGRHGRTGERSGLMFFLMQCTHHPDMESRRDELRPAHRDWVASGGEGRARVLVGSATWGPDGTAPRQLRHPGGRRTRCRPAPLPRATPSRGAASWRRSRLRGWPTASRRIGSTR